MFVLFEGAMTHLAGGVVDLHESQGRHFVTCVPSGQSCRAQIGPFRATKAEAAADRDLIIAAAISRVAVWDTEKGEEVKALAPKQTTPGPVDQLQASLFTAWAMAPAGHAWDLPAQACAAVHQGRYERRGLLRALRLANRSAGAA
jgi:hypothetical protein